MEIEEEERLSGDDEESLGEGELGVGNKEAREEKEEG